ncbi:flagellar basal body protein FliL [Micromonospora sp. NPDC047738]|uniref:LppU/SCO3897 family protein n=1 Tax=Micromonospora sp. NPDC047738 TaxID=3155741 RepID=UPI0033C0C1E3
MSNFGPPGDGSPGPWDGRRPEDEYGPPADPRYDPGYARQPRGWGEPPAQRHEPTVGWDTGQPAHQGYPPAAPGYAEPPYAEQPPYAGQPPHAGQPPYAEPARYAESTPPKRGRGRLVAGLAGLAVLLLGGAGAYWVLGRDEPARVSGSGAPASAVADPTAGASTPPDPATTTPAPATSTDSRFVKAGQCVRNEGSDGQQPKLAISECGAKTYQVLRRFDGPTSGQKDAEAKCAKVEGYTDWYFFDSELDTLDFVLCLKRR